MFFFLGEENTKAINRDQILGKISDAGSFQLSFDQFLVLNENQVQKKLELETCDVTDLAQRHAKKKKLKKRRSPRSGLN